MKFRKKPVEVEAYQWFKNGDHPKDYDSVEAWVRNHEGAIVRYFRRPDISGEAPCRNCSSKMDAHGWVDTLEGGHIVCPGDWIIRGVKGEYYPCKPDIFEATYEAAKLPEGYTEIDDVITQDEQTPARKAALDRARERLEAAKPDTVPVPREEYEALRKSDARYRAACSRELEWDTSDGCVSGIAVVQYTTNAYDAPDYTEMDKEQADAAIDAAMLAAAEGK